MFFFFSRKFCHEKVQDPGTLTQPGEFTKHEAKWSKVSASWPGHFLGVSCGSHLEVGNVGPDRIPVFHIHSTPPPVEGNNWYNVILLLFHAIIKLWMALFNLSCSMRLA